MAATKLITRHRTVFIIMGIATVAGTALTLGSAYLLHRATGMLYALACLIMVLAVAVLIIALGETFIYRPLRKFHQNFRDFQKQLAALIADADAAIDASDLTAARMARAKLVALMVEYRASLPANAPNRTDVDRMIAAAWPDTSDLPPAEPDEIFAILTARAERVSGAVLDATERALTAVKASAEAKTLLNRTIYDRDLSAEGGFNDPDKEQAVAEVGAAFVRTTTDALFTLITVADEVAPKNPELAAFLSDVYVRLSRELPDH